MSKVVLISGSPRIGGNTDKLADSFVQGCVENGTDVVRFDVAMMKVSGCTGCDLCYSNGMACVFHDIFNSIAEEIENADGVVVAAPLYWYALPAQIKCVVDRFHSFCVGERPVAGKKLGLISCCADEDAGSFEPLKGMFGLSARILGWEMVGDVLVTGLTGKDDVLGTDGCRRAKEFAGLFRRRFRSTSIYSPGSVHAK